MTTWFFKSNLSQPQTEMIQVTGIKGCIDLNLTVFWCSIFRNKPVLIVDLIYTAQDVAPTQCTYYPYGMYVRSQQQSSKSKLVK